ncbi:MAG: serine/threonine-protein kinase [Phycisphaerae bacterium]|nr:serine/threonine-protein kinase [Phycisphaerae bacterium]
MDASRYASLREMFHEACDVDPAERGQWLDRRCADDPEARREIEALFALERGSSDDRLRAPAFSPSLLEGARATLQGSAAEPTRIGEFEVLRKLGEGAMGVVYAGQQHHPRRTVALKLLRESSFWPARLQRFRREADLLGRLQHPGIARIYEAGVGEVQTADGPAGRQPFFALELIEGQPLLDFANERGLDTRARLELLARIADAVHHAHGRGVIHRDLKPGNILVEADGQPKILDFGISIAADATDATLQTQPGQVLGTLAYASPEQLRGTTDAVDTRSDIYSLGAILFELLTGRLPIDVRGLAVPQAIQRLVESDPPPASNLIPALRGDVTAIVAKALEKSPDQRYASAAGLAADIRRYLNDEPITARPFTAAVALRKFVRRHQAAVVGGVLALVATVTSLAGGLMLARQQRDAARAAAAEALAARSAEKLARENAQQETAIADAVNAFLNEDLLMAAGPDNAPDRDLRVRDLLDRASDKVENKFPTQPLVEAGVRTSLGYTYMRLAEYGLAERHLARALALRREHMSPHDPRVMESISTYANLVYHQGRYPEAANQFETLLKASRSAHPGDYALTATTLGSLGFIRMRLNQLTTAETLLEEAASMTQRLGADRAEIVRTLNNLATCKLRLKRFADCERLLREALTIADDVFGPEHPETLNVRLTLAGAQNDQGRYDDALGSLLELYEIQVRIFGPEHPQPLITLSNCAYSIFHLGRREEALGLLQHVVQARGCALGPTHPHTIMGAELLASFLELAGANDAAEAMLLGTIDAARDELGAISPRAFPLARKLSKLLAARGDFDQADHWCAIAPF